MKILLSFVTLSMSLGTVISLRLIPESFLYFPLYLFACYHIFRVNFSEGFFLVFLEKKDKEKEEETGKVRLGPTEIRLKDDSDRNEDKFMDLFDWKKSSVRKLLSWGVFATAIWLLIYRLHLEVSMETVAPILAAFLLMRVIAVGHLLIPLGINLLVTLKGFRDYSTTEYSLLFIYGILFILCLTLIYPSDERVSGKVSQWLSGKWLETGMAAGLLVMSFCVGMLLFGDMELDKKKPDPLKEELKVKSEKLKDIQSSLKDLTGTGMLKASSLMDETKRVQEELEESLHSQDQKQAETALKHADKVIRNFESTLTSSPTPDLTPERLEYMKNDLRSAAKTGIDPEIQKRMDALLSRLDQYDGKAGSDLASEFREIKHGNKGYYREETDLPYQAGAYDSKRVLEEMTKADIRQKELREKLNQNIEEMKGSGDEGLQAVNSALKSELEKTETMSEAEKSHFLNELTRTKNLEDQLLNKINDPSLKDKIKTLSEKNDSLARKLTPHMNAEEKSALAAKVLDHQKELDAVIKEAKESLARENFSREQKDPESKKESTFNYKKYLRMAGLGALVLFVMWFIEKLNKKGVKQVSGISDEVKDDLVQKFHEMRSLKLSPREEVIHTYNILHEGLQTLVFTNETPPSCIVYEGIKAAEPELSEPTFTVTETFARTFYGESDVSPDALRAFRKDISKIFRFFEIPV